jgi:thioredoxin-related protein
VASRVWAWQSTLITKLAQLSLVALLLGVSHSSLKAEDDPIWDLTIDDRPTRQAVEHPAWFRLSFLDLRDDLADAVAQGKRGLAVYFGQRHCPYCRSLMEVNFADPAIAHYTQRHFEVVALDIHGYRQVTDLQGRTLSESRLATRERARFSPTLIFYDANGKQALRLSGYYPPYPFMAALEYVADGHYQRETLREYIDRATPGLAFEEGEMNEAPFLDQPPHRFNRRHFAAQRPLMVLFDQGNCHACDVMHTIPLQQAEIRRLIEQFDTAQLDRRGDEPIVTPNGDRRTSREWADELEIFYTPTLIFFDQQGEEIIRVDSVAGILRLRDVMEFVLSEAWRHGTSFSEFRRGH